VDAWRVALLESSLDCVIVMDADGVVLDINRGIEEAFGFSRSIIGRRLADVFVPPELREAHQRGLARYLESGRSQILGTRVEVPALHASGRRILVELSVVRLPGSRPPLFVGHLRSIEEQKRREMRLRASAAASRALAIGDQADTVTREVLKAIGQELGWPVVQYWSVAPDRSRIDVAHTWVDDAYRDELAACHSVASFKRGDGLPGAVWESGEAIWLEDVRTAANLPRCRALGGIGIRTALCLPVFVRAQIVATIEAFSLEQQSRDPQLLALLDAVAGQVGHCIDDIAAHAALGISEARLRQSLEREREARAAAEEANHAKDRLLAMVSHELRTPLGPILGWAKMLQSTSVTPDVQIRALEAIQRNAELQTRLVDDLVDMSRMSAGKLVLSIGRVDLVQVVQAAIETLHHDADLKQITLDFHGEVALPSLRGDSKRLQQVVANLIGNAVKFTPAGGRVAIGIRRQKDRAMVSVADTGIGIEPASLITVFEPFHQLPTESMTPGLGLGLAIVREIVAAHHGTVEALSDGIGAGSTFVVALPLDD